MPTRTTLLVSNFWHNPGITMRVVHDSDAPLGSVHLEMDLADFEKSVLAEMPHPAFTWTSAQLTSHMAAAFALAIEKMKLATVGQI